MTFNFVRRSGAWLALLAGIALAGCEEDSSGPTPTASVTIEDFLFDPEDIVVEPGTQVTWTWSGAGVEPHNVTFADPGITDSPTQTTGTFTTTMPTTPGIYEYQCTEHPIAMNGSIEVQ